MLYPKVIFFFIILLIASCKKSIEIEKDGFTDEVANSGITWPSFTHGKESYGFDKRNGDSHTK